MSGVAASSTGRTVTGCRLPVALLFVLGEQGERRGSYREVETLFDEFPKWSGFERTAVDVAESDGEFTVTVPKARETHEEEHRVPIE